MMGICTFNSIVYHESLDLDKPIYKFFPLKRFLEATASGNIFFSNVLNWDDPWELPTKLFETSGLDEKDKLFFDKYKRLDTYATCFTEQFNTDAMWRIYSPEKNSICIETTPRKILDKMLKYSNYLSMYMAPVIYIDATNKDVTSVFNKEQLEQYPNCFYSAFIKRNEFMHENEIRLAFQILQGIPNDSPTRGRHLGVSFSNIIDNLYLDPRLDDYEVAYHKYALEALGYNVEQSQLYKHVEFNGKDFEDYLSAAKITIMGTKGKAFVQNTKEE